MADNGVLDVRSSSQGEPVYGYESRPWVKPGTQHRSVEELVAAGHMPFDVCRIPHGDAEWYLYEMTLLWLEMIDQLGFENVPAPDFALLPMELHSLQDLWCEKGDIGHCLTIRPDPNDRRALMNAGLSPYYAAVYYGRKAPYPVVYEECFEGEPFTSEQLDEIYGAYGGEF